MHICVHVCVCVCVYVCVCVCVKLLTTNQRWHIEVNSRMRTGNAAKKPSLYNINQILTLHRLYILLYFDVHIHYGLHCPYASINKIFVTQYVVL